MDRTGARSNICIHTDGIGRVCYTTLGTITTNLYVLYVFTKIQGVSSGVGTFIMTFPRFGADTINILNNNEDLKNKNSRFQVNMLMEK